MLRLTAPGNERLLQRPRFEASFGGAEANVAVSLSRFGMETAIITVLPENPLGDACVRHLMAQGVDVSWIQRSEGRMGIYYLELGAGGRPGKVIYDRAGSCMSLVSPEMIDWAHIFKGSDWFHLSGITPAISQSAADASIAAVRAAKDGGLTVSCDYNYRGKLWNYGKSAPEVMVEIMESVDVGIGSTQSCEMALGIEAAQSGGEWDNAHRVRAVAEAVLSRFPRLRMQAIPWRAAGDGNQTRITACLFTGENFRISSSYKINPVVDRVGAGDAFSAGLIYAMMRGDSGRQALEFATGAACLKYSIPGDWNLVSVAEVERLISGGSAGWIER
jgi:2-dehydro-3-deoxygluconokinase